MDDIRTFKESTPILIDIPRFDARAEALESYLPTPLPMGIPPLNLALFLLTLLTTTMAGADMAGAPVMLWAPLQSLINLKAGLSYSIPLMSILLAHEMGHYLTARRYGIDSSLPYFIPSPFEWIFFIVPFVAPLFVGTFGAFIRMRSRVRTRRAMFDIGAAGPWAGFVLALIAVIVGLRLSTVGPLDTSTGGAELGNSMLFWMTSRVVLGVDPNSVNIDLHPIALAGWFGLFVTALNLLPVGQLDGGHTVYALLGPRWHRIISRACWLGTALMVVVPYALGKDFWSGWLVWFVLVFALGLGHPSTADSETPLAGRRRWMGWATVALFISTFAPVPVLITTPTAPPAQQLQPRPQEPAGGQGINVMHPLPAGVSFARHPVFST